MKESTLDTICYICQDIHTEKLEDKSIEIPTVIILIKRKEYPNSNINLVASKAFLDYYC